jgi:hypothetical protein
MTNAMDSAFHILGTKNLWEVQIAGSTPGDTDMDSPVLTTVKIKIWGIFGATVNKQFSKVAWVEDVDAFVSVREPIDITSQIENDDILYEIVQEIKGEYYLGGKVYLYGLKRQESTPCQDLYPFPRTS